MGKLNDVTFVKGNGGLGRPAANEDPVSGLILLLRNVAAADLMNAENTSQFDSIASQADNGGTVYVTKLRYAEELADYGLEKKDVDAQESAADFKKQGEINAIIYHVSEFFRMNEQGTLYLMIRLTGGIGPANIVKDDIKQLQYYANGSIRQCGILTDALTGIADYQTACTELEQEHQPLSVVIAYKGKTVAVAAGDGGFTTTTTAVVNLSDLNSSSTNYMIAGRRNLSLMVGCDLDSGVVRSLAEYGYYGAIGLVLGAISKAHVHESIAYVAKFPLSLSVPGLISGEPIKEVSVMDQEKINDNRYIFVRIHVGDADNYFNDSHTLDVLTSDYAYIENNRTIDKAIRGIRRNLLPYLSSPLDVDASTGKLDNGTVKFLEATAGDALTDMEKAGELSGYSVGIDADQNVLATSEVEIVIKNVPKGVMRKVKVKIGFTTNI